MTGPSRAADALTPGPGRATILVVEDIPEHLEIARVALADAGFRVEGAVNGRAALDRLSREPLPDLVLVDLFMPEMDGWQLVTELKARPALTSIPVVVLTGGGPRALSSAPVSAGYLEKPIDPARLVGTITACLARKVRKASGTYPVED